MTYSVTNNDNTPALVLRGSAVGKTNCTIAQDAARSAALAFGTIMTHDPINDKWEALDSVSMSSAHMLCGANGGNIAAWEAVTDGEFAITVDGVAMDITGLDFDTVDDLEQVVEIINKAANGRFICLYDSVGDVFKFVSPSKGEYISSVTVLSAVSGGSGTDISGASFLNGLTGTGTATAATGAKPRGVYVGSGLTAAAIVAGDVTNNAIYTNGYGLVLDKNSVVLENSLALTDQIVGEHDTIESELSKLGITFTDSEDVAGYENS